MPATKRSRRRALSDEERAQRREADRKLMAEAIEQLRSSEGWQRWLRVRRHFHSYSLHNQLLIASQCPEATRVAGYRHWLKLGYAVRRGERGIRIWAPCPPSKRKLRQWREEGANPEKKPRTFFRLVSVFDRSQVDPLPDFPGGPVELDPPIHPVEGDSLAALFEPLAKFAASIGYTVAVEEIPGSALGYCQPQRYHIGVEAVSESFSPNAQVAVTIHELAHALVRCERLAKDPELTYSQEEVVVESVAFSVCSAVGLDTSQWSVPYMATWGEGVEVERYAQLIDRLASRLEDAALPSEPAGTTDGAHRLLQAA
jgi:antirestriction protein ArdC